MADINYSEKIPNNVNLAEDRTLQRALEQWQPNFLNWWKDMGPEGSPGLRRLPAHGCRASTPAAGRTSTT